jgi:hypothetical protein
MKRLGERPFRAAAPILSTALFAALAVYARSASGQQASPADRVSIWTLQDENASISTASLTDRYYVNGLRLGWTSGVGVLPDALEHFGRTVWGDGQQRISFDLSQQIFTPADTEAKIPPPGDRPYAGILLGTFSLISDTPLSRSTLSLGLGVVGPSALGKQVQKGFHRLIGQQPSNGWDTQLNDEPAVQLYAGRVWRVSTGSLGGLETDALPEVGAGLGTVRVYGLAGARFRFGQGLASDYGPARVRPGLSGGDAFQPTRPFAWYVFVGADGQAVAHDVTLDGNTWRESPSVDRNAAVGELEFGFALMAYGARITYTQVFQTQEFAHQKGGLHQFGSLAASFRF